ncbi:hypothetical protein ACFQ5D_24890, partial [Paenibacillus farraposensis]
VAILLSVDTTLQTVWQLAGENATIVCQYERGAMSLTSLLLDVPVSQKVIAKKDAIYWQLIHAEHSRQASRTRRFHRWFGYVGRCPCPVKSLFRVRGHL